MSAQGKDVSTIKASNIVSGKRPVKVEVINEQSSDGAARLENVRMSWASDSSTHNDAPYAEKITIQADTDVNPVRLSL